MGLRKYITEYKVDDYQQWEGEWELWDGVAVSMGPSPFGRHQKIVTEISRRILVAMEKSECKDCEVATELDWIVSDVQVVRPDISLVCHSDIDRFIEVPPTLIIEVQSESTATLDRSQKRDLYAVQGVKHYVMIDSKDKSVAVLQLGLDGAYHEVDAEKSIPLNLHENCCIELDFNISP